MRACERTPAHLRPPIPSPALSRRGLAAGLAVAVAALAAATAPAAEVEVSARVEPREIGPGEMAQLVIEARGGVFTRMSLEPTFELSNLEIVGGPARLENLQYVNGATSRSVRLVWQLAPRETGQAAVYDLVVEVGGERYDLPALEVRVTDRPTGGGGPPPGARRPPPWWRLPDPLADFFERRRPRGTLEPPEVRLVAEVTPGRVYAGEQLLYSLYLYTQTNITRISASQIPDFRGFWVEEIPRPEDAATERTTLDGEVFWRTPLLRRVLFPLRPGRYGIEPAEVQVVAQGASASPFTRDLPRSEMLTLRSDGVAVEVEPVPPPEGGGRYDGLVGRFSLDARLAPAEVPAGEAATLELTLSGRGNLQAARAPALPALAGLSVLPFQEEGGQRIVGQQVEGSRVWRVPLVPEGPGTWHLPALEIPYFDPAAGEYRVARSARLELTAHRPRQGTSPGRHPIRSAALPAEGALSPWSGLMPWLFAAPWLLALVVAAARRRPGVAGAPSPAPVHGDPRRRFEARLATAAGQERPRQAAREIEEAWRELLAVVAAVPREQPAAAWPRLLAARDPAAGDDMAGIIEDLHYLRYAPQLSAIASLRGELVDRSARLGRRLANGSGRRRR